MSRYTRDSRDRVFDAVDMLALVGARTELRRAGVDSYFGLCPFHDERTASFHVRPDEKHYYCFGCHASGDPFTFVMETEGVDFKGALESLAGRFGVALQTEDEDPAAAVRRQRRERLYTLLDRAAAYYSRYLWEAREAAQARDYLLGRGLSADTLREFRVGFSPSAWESLVQRSRAAGFSEEELLAAGLAQRSRRGTLIDRFRGQIMFPSADARGRVVGFGARTLGEDPRRPKYVNTAEGELYHKRAQLYGIDRARAEAARAGRMLLVEGYTDVLALHQSGIRNAVGIMGTSFTEEQATELARIVKVLELCLDADAAGQQAMLRAAGLAAGHSLELRVVTLPAGQDPGELIATEEGIETLRARVSASVPFVVFRVEQVLARADTGSAEGRDRALAELRPVLAELAPSVVRDELTRRVAGALSLSETQLALVVAGPGPRPLPASTGSGAGPGRRSDVTQPAGLSQGLRQEQTFLALCVALPEAGERTLRSIDPDELLTSELHRRAARHLLGRTDAPMADLPPGDDELARLVAALVSRAGRGRPVEAEQLRHAQLILELARVERALVRARARGEGGVGELAREREQVRAELHGVVSRLERAV